MVTELARVTPASALVALNEFSHIDKHTVKSVAGYLIGIIKRVGRDKGMQRPPYTRLFNAYEAVFV